MKKRIITSLLFLGIIPIIVFGGSSCTFEDILEHSNEKHKELDENGNNEEYDFIITPKNITGDFREFFQTIVNTYSNVLIKDGIYEIDLTNHYQGVKPKNGCIITFEPNAKIKVKPNNLDIYSVITLRARSNITLINPNIEGDKYNHLGNTGEWGHGINVSDCSDVVIKNARIVKMWGDGVYMKNCNNITIKNIYLSDNRRQGISIISGRDIKIHDLVVEKTGGTSPGYGVDIEPNWNGESVIGLRLYNPIFRNNGNKSKGSHMVGFCLTTRASTILNPIQNKLVDSIFDIEIFDPVFENNMLFITPHSNHVRGSIKVHRPVFYNSKGVALYFRNHQSDFFQSEVIDPKFINCVESPQNSVDKAPIVFHCSEQLSIKREGTKNITIINPKIETTHGIGLNSIAIFNISSNNFTNDMKNVRVHNISLKGYEKGFYNTKEQTDIHSTFSLNFSDISEIPKIQSGNVTSNTFDGMVANYTGNTENPKIYLDKSIPISDAEFYYTNNSSNKSSLELIFGKINNLEKMYIQNWDTEKFSGIELPYGTFIKLKKIKSNRWVISSASGSIRPIK
ncbi:right-handed parallel beta-helix repeat-containing protein [Capnocytophaga cynodegmi]|uniref:right-handed parallel beta-helix repeat-containing protein n=1 Tax=Capnocytophaga cynodegmi TaxID=28189 RepID=UPI00385D7B26